MLAVTAALVCVGCQSTPSPIPPSGDAPCITTTEHECSDHGCCLELESCGGDDPSCPATSCCYVGGPPEFGVSSQRKMRPKRRQK